MERAETIQHWDTVHADNGLDDVSWHQREPVLSFQLLATHGVRHDARVLDVGCGVDGLAERLVQRGWSRVTGLDLSRVAIETTRTRLGDRAAHATWIAGNILAAPLATYDVWHDRAALHFLTDPSDIAAYGKRIREHLAPGGLAIVATFALDGPATCSGLPVARYDGAGLAKALGLTLVDSQHEVHTTPWGSTQSFTWAALRR
jgi:2-polyprenyl-3-methyl-5-hydroxy-6-metoxy-1,4-benzoquinol methylase